MRPRQPFRPPQPASATRPEPLPTSHALRNVLVVLILLLGGFAAYAYTHNPRGCRQVADDARALALSLLPPGLVPAGIAPGHPVAESASTPADAATPSTLPNVIPAQPDWTWTTLDGKTYHDVVITKIESGTVTITHADGVAHIPMTLLPDDLKKQLHYGPPGAAAATSAATAATGPIARLIQGKLVDASGTPVPAPGNDVQYYALYYSAAWCPPCHIFTPKLVAWYNKFKPSHPNFEIIFVSDDQGASAMLGYMKEMSMPWPAVQFSELTHNGTGIEKYAGPGIPDLVLVDAGGKVLADSFNGNTYLGPASVVEAINRIVGGTSPVPLVREMRPARGPDRSAMAIAEAALR